MPIRKGRLYRICKRCGETFKPTGRCSYICKKCNQNTPGPGSWIDKIIMMQKNRCKYLKMSNGKKLCTHRFNNNYNNYTSRLCETDHCPLDVK